MTEQEEIIALLQEQVGLLKDQVRILERTVQLSGQAILQVCLTVRMNLGNTVSPHLDQQLRAFEDHFGSNE